MSARTGTSRHSAVQAPQKCVEKLSRDLSTASLARKLRIGIASLGFLAVTTSWANTLPDFSKLVQEEGEAVVQISVTTEVAAASGIPGLDGFDPEQLPEYFRRFLEQNPRGGPPAPRPGSGFGSGFITTDDGYIITNAHVVDSATDIRVALNDRREYEAELIGSDTSTDIAVLKIDAGDLPVVRMGDSDDLVVGEWVLAIGSPFGFEHTATQGIVSALARSLPDDTYVPFIQTDVAVNPGNSGGPLFNTDGEVVGVNSQIYSRSGGYQGLSFAIPINVAMSIADQLRDKGFASRGWLGVTIQSVDQSLARTFGLDRPTGALVAQVTEDSPAAKAGLRPSDIILRFNGRKVESSNALPPLVGAVAPGESVEAEVLRDRERQIIEVTIEELEGGDSQAQATGQPDSGDTNVLGAVVADLSDEQREQLGVDTGGVVISEVEPGGAAAAAGLRAGDVILSFNRSKVAGARALSEAVKAVESGSSVPVLVQRNGTPLFVALELGKDQG